MIQRKPRYLFVFLLAAGLTTAGCLPFLSNPSHAESREEKEMDKQVQSQVLTCPKCKGQMESGTILDYWSNQTWNQSQWALGTPKPSFFSGAPKSRNVFTFRCTTCGYLESYAR
jgi:Domain of unknown function (DUF6487)